MGFLTVTKVDSRLSYELTVLDVHYRHFSLHLEVISGAPQVSGLGPLIFIIFINDFCDVIKQSKYL
jgi:hypothetical protein